SPLCNARTMTSSGPGRWVRRLSILTTSKRCSTNTPSDITPSSNFFRCHMAKVFHVSNSKVKLWRKCRRAYWYRYVERLRVKRKKRPLMFGSIVHGMIETFVNADDPFAYLDEQAKTNMKLFRSEREEYGELIDDVRTIMTEYFDRDWGTNRDL